MKKLLKDPEAFYRPKDRPSGHDISAGFGNDNGGAIPSNLLQIPNTDSNSHYLRMCKQLGYDSHPARFPGDLPRFFIKFLTTAGDTVVDIFSGSNTTGAIAEELGRRWVSIDEDRRYAALSAIRFVEGQTEEKTAELVSAMIKGEALDISAYAPPRETEQLSF
jgi:site-specific DNA-methyltransferase (cytosine-N4-specific)